MKIFLTGHKGYIGAHLLRLLKEEGHIVIGCDLDLYASDRRRPLFQADVDLCMDIRSLTPKHFQGCDCVMHLAAISNDPMGELSPALTEQINLHGSVHVAKAAKSAGVPRFLFSSSCSVYGTSDTIELDENAPLQPLSTYAKSKIEAERQIAALASPSFSPTYLRNATAFGDSPMLRLDLVVNNLLASAQTTGEIRLQSDGTPWRPLMHAEDIARAFIAFLHAPRTLIHNFAVNVGMQNVQVREIVQKILLIKPAAKIVFGKEAKADPRDYCVSFDFLRSLLPQFRPRYTLELGLQEMAQSFENPLLSREQFEQGSFTRIALLKNWCIRSSGEFYLN